MTLTGKVALVTGASRGIGKSIAVQLAKEGATVIINYAKDDKTAQETLKEIKDEGITSQVIKGDVSDYQFTKQMIDGIVQKYGKIDILINNAGISKIGLFMDMTEEDWDSLINVNLKGVFNCCNNVIKYMINQKSGSIVNISSIWGEKGASCEVIYSASKGGINAFTKALAKELAPSNIRVNAIAPGVIDTEMNKCFNEEERENIIEEIPMMRFGESEEVGKLVVFLVSEASSYITGQIITIDGGFI